MNHLLAEESVKLEKHSHPLASIKPSLFSFIGDPFHRAIPQSRGPESI